VSKVIKSLYICTTGYINKQAPIDKSISVNIFVKLQDYIGFWIKRRKQGL